MTSRADSIAFLAAMLPETGVYSYRYPWREGKPPNRVRFVSAIDELFDGLQAGDGIGDSYFSTASFREATRAEAGNVAGKRALYLDLDCTPKQAMQAVIRHLVGELHLPKPVFVLSGRGVHAWWPLKKAIPLETWLPLAQGLKVACRELGVPADAAVTADPARIMRCPGTHNRKYATGAAMHEVCFHPACKLEAHDENAFKPLLAYAPVETFSEPQPSEAKPLSADEQIYYRSMLTEIPPPETYGRALEIGMALHHAFHADDTGFELWWQWYEQSQEAKSQSGVACEKLHDKWDGFNDRREDGITAASLAHWATEHGWHPLPPIEPIANGEDKEPRPNGHDASDSFADYRQTLEKMQWIKSLSGVLKRREYENARKAIAELRIRGRHDLFTARKEFLLPWQAGKDWQTYSDDTDHEVRNHVCDAFYCDMGLTNITGALKEVAELGAYNSILDYLAAREWDSQSRVDTWLITYCGAENTAVNRAIGRLVLIAAVRRAKRPGTKFDHILILEGDEGIGKSRTVQILAGEAKYFSDMPILTENAKIQHELIEGVWFYEISEFSGIRKAQADLLKAFITRDVDCSRKAYARERTSSLRSCIFIVTTNHCVEDKYLQDDFGLRRFWPVKIGTVDQDALQRDRDQLFAEAVILEKTHGAYLDMPKELAAELKAEQEKRVLIPDLADALERISGKKDPVGETVTTSEIKVFLGLPVQYQNAGFDRKIAAAMTFLGWERVQMRDNGRCVRGYRRGGIGDANSDA